jgi:hypothetical protein
MATKAVRYSDGTLMMPGSEAFELHQAGKHEELAKHMKQLDETWRKLEGRPPKGSK